MKIVLRTLAVLCVAIGAFLIYAVIHAMASAGGARTGVAIGYVVGAIVLTLLAVWMWRRPSSAESAASVPPAA
jgi:multisubunit Na+/H+ antiporter MnhB subunit